MLLSIHEGCYSVLGKNRVRIIRFVPGKYILVSTCLSVLLLGWVCFGWPGLVEYGPACGRELEPEGL